MRLRQEFRTQHVTFKVRRAAVVAAWALATAAVFAGVVTWRNWLHGQQEVVTKTLEPVPAAKTSPESNSSAGAHHENAAELTNGMPPENSAGADSSEILVADNELTG